MSKMSSIDCSYLGDYHFQGIFNYVVCKEKDSQDITG